MGVLPSAVTSAESSWIPFGVGAGRSMERDKRETRLIEMRQLTFDGESGAPVWHPDSRHLVYQSARAGEACSQLHRMDLATGKTVRMSPDKGWAGSAAYTPNGELVFAYIPAAAPPCPAFGGGLSWALPESDIIELAIGYSAEPKVLAKAAGYDGDPTVGRDGRLVFTSLRDGDPELYGLLRSGTPARITQAPGYDGNPHFSPDGTRLVWQAERGESGDGARAPIERGGVSPHLLEIWRAGSDGQNARVVTRHAALSITPSFLPDSRRILYASDFDDARRKGGAPQDVYEELPVPAHDFEIYLVDPDGPLTSGGGPRVERITYHPGFDGEAVVSPDGRYVAFTSGRHADRPGGTNVFIARWNDDE